MTLVYWFYLCVGNGVLTDVKMTFESSLTKNTFMWVSLVDFFLLLNTFIRDRIAINLRFAE